MPDSVLYLLIGMVAGWFLCDGMRVIWDCLGVDEWDDDGSKP